MSTIAVMRFPACEEFSPGDGLCVSRKGAGHREGWVPHPKGENGNKALDRPGRRNPLPRARWAISLALYMNGCRK